MESNSGDPVTQVPITPIPIAEVHQENPQDEETVTTTSPQKQQLSGVAVVIIIAVGVQTFIMLFIFAKRQITRFTLRGRRGPHISVGQGGLRVLRKEIDRRIEYAAHVRQEPRLINYSVRSQQLDGGGGGGLPYSADAGPPAYIFRMVAVDRLLELDTLVSDYDPSYFRPAGSNLRSFLIDCLAGPLAGLEPKRIHRYCDMYDAARHSYEPFGEQQFNDYVLVLKELKLQVIHNIRNKPHQPQGKKSTCGPISSHANVVGVAGPGLPPGGVNEATSTPSVAGSQPTAGAVGQPATQHVQQPTTVRRAVNRPQWRTFSAKSEPACVSLGARSTTSTDPQLRFRGTSSATTTTSGSSSSAVPTSGSLVVAAESGTHTTTTTTTSRRGTSGQSTPV